MLNLDMKQKLGAQTVIATGMIHHFQLTSKLKTSPASTTSNCTPKGVLQESTNF